MVHCLFEQSGTFKNEFIKLGIPATDYDIQNNFGETDNVVDLFTEIEKCYGGGYIYIRQNDKRRFDNGLFPLHIFFVFVANVNDLGLQKLCQIKHATKNGCNLGAVPESGIFLGISDKDVDNYGRKRVALDYGKPVVYANIFESEFYNATIVN